MKNFSFIFFVLVISFSLHAQIPNRLKLQLLVLDNNNNTITNQAVGIRISILKGSTTGEPVCTEVFNKKTNDFGLITLEVGSMNPYEFSKIVWKNNIYFTKTEIDIEGGSNYSLIGTSQLISVPFCLYAKFTDKVDETDPSFLKWDKSSGIQIQEYQISNLKHFKNSDESDPVYKSSSVSGITETEIIKWNDNEELDSLFKNSPAFSITPNDTLRWNNKSNFNGQYNALSGLPSLSLICTTGKYDELLNQPLYIVSHKKDLGISGLIQFDGSKYVTIPNGLEGQQLTINSAGQLEWKYPEKEIFDNSDRPFFEYNTQNDYYDCKPWNYYKSYNLTRRYPLVIYLHGGGGAGNIKNLGLYYLGYDTNDGIDDIRAKNFQISHSSFILVPQTTAGEWDSNKLISLIEDYKKNYRIDTTRIYLIGYSMGGSGSYLLANAYYDYDKQLFAGIIRLAGQSQTTLRDAIAQKTSIWLHIGLTDSDLRINITREAYDFLRKFHSDGIETSSNILITGYNGTTLTLTKGNKEIVKKTEYDNVGHGISSFPFQDSYLITWLFSQKVE